MPDGSHLVFVLLTYQEARSMTFEESREGAISSVRATRSEAKLHALLDSLRAIYPVQMIEERL
jgi:hypothetical protein